MDSNGIPVAPAPWKLKYRSWIMILSSLKSTKTTYQSEDGVTKTKLSAVLPSGWAAPSDQEALEKGEYVSGPGSVMLLQYTETPVGPYDELVYTPGVFSMDEKKQIKGPRITRIYVSTKESTANGRRNWNIPKQVANFNYTHHPDGSWDLSVSLPSSSKPFFHVSTSPIPILGSLRIPISTSPFSSFMKIVQPPFPESKQSPSDKEPGDHPELIASNTNPDGSTVEPKWASLATVMKGKMYLATYKPKLPLEGSEGKFAIADGVQFPAVVPWKMIACLEDGDTDFGIPEWY